MANVLLDIGRQILTGCLKRLSSGPGSAEPKYLAIGTGTGTSARTDTALFTETGTRVAGTTSQTTTTVTNDTYQIQGTIAVGSPTAVTNAGAFDASSAGNGFIKGDFAVINLGAGDSISLTVSMQFT